MYEVSPPSARSGGAAGRPYRVALVVGTRPEVIKMAPVIRALAARRDAVEPVVVATSQHREMLDQALAAFGIRPDVDLNLMRPAQTYEEFTARAVAALTDCFSDLRPDALLIQGDTATVAAAAMVGRARQVLVGHVEAGLRSWDLTDPYPEELNRRIATAVSDIHFAPTELARRNLLLEGVPEDDVVVTGNTAVDALSSTPIPARFTSDELRAVPWEGRQVLLLTVHRRENWGSRLRAIAAGVRAVVARHPRVEVVVPVHRNPAVRSVVRSELGATPRVHLVEPLTYPDMLAVLRRCYLIMSDSGGLQEEVAVLRKPILVLRDSTERPEAVDAGFARLVGARPALIEAEASRLLEDPAACLAMCSGENPFGDGAAAPRIVGALVDRLDARATGLPFAASRGPRSRVRRLVDTRTAEVLRALGPDAVAACS